MNRGCWQDPLLLKPSEELHLKKCLPVFKEEMLQQSPKVLVNGNYWLSPEGDGLLGLQAAWACAGT